MTDLEKKAHELCETFLKDPTVVRFFEAKKAYMNDPHLSSLRREEDEGKKNLRFLNSEERDKEFIRLRKIQKEIDNDALTVNYHNLEAEVERMLRPIKTLFNFYN